MTANQYMEGTENLWARYHTSPTPDNRNAIVMANCKLAYAEAHKLWQKPGVSRVFESLEELATECLMGLMRAVTRYNPDSGVPFSVFAFRVIFNAGRTAWRLRRAYTKRHKATRLEQPVYAPETPETPESVDWAEIEQIAGKDYEMVRMRCVDGLTFREIGERLGKHSQWIQHCVARAGSAIAAHRLASRRSRLEQASA